MRKRLVFSCVALAAVLVVPLAQGADISPGDRADIERQLEQTRDEIRRLSERLAELSLDLVDEPMRKLHRAGGPMVKARARVAMGVTIQSVTGQRGATVMAVTPDGPADRAGIRTGDVIVGLGDVSLVDGESGASSTVTHFMREVEAGDTINVKLERDGKPMSVDLVAEQLDHPGMFSFNVDTEFFEDMGENIERHMVHKFGDIGPGAVNMDGHGGFEFLFHSGPWSDMEVVVLTPTLGDYFGVSEGLLIVRAPADSGVDLREGDVIVRLDGNELGDRRELGRALAGAQRNDTVRFDIVRQRQSMTVDATVPATAAHDDDRARVIIKRFEVDED
jgi:membrane-associated protease RseP (regulator of RpoE activity)